ncbi:MAG: hypothetical protein U9Q80_02255, partial [Bacillota bacterium]|nr:hypothetical protein [Bacillota bacterium]
QHHLYQNIHHLVLMAVIFRKLRRESSLFQLGDESLGLMLKFTAKYVKMRHTIDKNIYSVMQGGTNDSN